jgi:hypothetical protein
MGLLGGTMFALDGCKLPSNASKEWSGTVSELRRKKDKIEGKLKRLVREQIESDREEDNDGEGEDDGGGSSGLSNKTKQVERLKREAERIERFLQDNGAKIGRQGREIKSNITDNESAMMKTSHGVIQGYNGQALVDSKHQVIVHGEAFGIGPDHDLLSPMIEGAKENMEAIGKGEEYFNDKVLVADTNSHCEENLRRWSEEGLEAYIPDTGFRKMDPRFATQGRYRAKKERKFELKDFVYDKGHDEYICPGGKRLRAEWIERKTGGSGYKRYRANKEDCDRCPLRGKCVRRTNIKGRNLMVPIGSSAPTLSEQMAEKIDTEAGRNMYEQRMGIVEPVFANIRVQKRMDRFTLRGKIKVNIQWLLYCIVHNMGKIASYGFT